jgi:putative peptidoglycan lipid II flippase
MVLNVIFSFGFAWIFNRIGWMPHGGLALANSFATALEGSALLVIMRRRLNGIEGKSIADGTLRVSVASLGMAIGVWFWMQAAAGMSRWVIALGGVVVGGIIYLIAVTILRVPEMQMVIEMITRRLHRSPTS